MFVDFQKKVTSTNTYKLDCKGAISSFNGVSILIIALPAWDSIY
jgi:hypothetical protein